MVAPKYSAESNAFAKQVSLGGKPTSPPPPEPKPKPRHLRKAAG
jgi:predicted transcriptional regulator